MVHQIWPRLAHSPGRFGIRQVRTALFVEARFVWVYLLLDFIILVLDISKLVVRRERLHHLGHNATFGVFIVEGF